MPEFAPPSSGSEASALPRVSKSAIAAGRRILAFGAAWLFALGGAAEFTHLSLQAQQAPVATEEKTPTDSGDQASAVEAEASDEEASAASSAEFEQAKKALAPLFRQLTQAHSTRATVELSVDTIIDGAVIGSETSTYQIASQTPDQYTVYLKNESQKTRIYSNGKNTTIALSPIAYTELPNPIPMLQAVYQLPLPMGPYPEPVLALTLASVDPSVTLVEGMRSLAIADRGSFRGKTPSIHFVGVQEDAVKWDLWITQGDAPKPLRLLVDLTEMLRANGATELPAGYRYLLRFDFTNWRVNHPNSPALFNYVPAGAAQKFDSIEEYLQKGRSPEPTNATETTEKAETPSQK